MRLREYSLLSLVLLSAALVAGCEEKEIFRPAAGIPVIEEYGPNGEVSLVTETMVDFGPVLVGSRLERKVVLRNDGRGSFRVETVTEGEGFDSAFRYQFEPFTLAVGDRKELAFYFEPSGDEGDRASTLTLNVIDGSADALVIELKGRAVKGGCAVEPNEKLDFGSVALQTSFTKQVKISNSSDLDWKVTIDNISSELDADAFRFSGFEAGEYTVPAHGELIIPIEFKPLHNGEHSAFLPIPAPAMCQPNILQLTGKGVDQVLECEPKVLAVDPQSGAERWLCRLDFGFVNPNSKAVSQALFRNLGNQDITVTGLELSQPPGKGEPFALETTETSFVVPAGGGETPIPLSFLPTLLGLQTGRLYYLTDDAKLAEGTIDLMGTGGGPDIEVQPARVDFGRVAVDTFQRRRITIANVGTDVGGTTEDNLKLATKNGEQWEEKRAELVTDFPDEFSLEWPPQGYLPQGIAAGQNVDLRIKFAPTSPGIKEATVRIFSNDPDEPTVEVTVVGGAEVLPPCDYEVVPSQL
ncbi:MAG: choice-of-anchor D domain-containing protein, partial [Myxococcales bacterium]